jgi:AcrR family transcriptional regulator
MTRANLVEPRRLPSQERSRERVEQILEAAERLIAESGTGALKTRDIAAIAKIPIGSVYQYFPNREAIIRAIVERYHDRLDKLLEETLFKVTSREQMVIQHGEMVEIYYNFLRSSPSILNLWSGSLHTKTLLEMSIEDSKRAAQKIHKHVLELLPPKQKERALAFFLISVDITGSIGKLAIGIGDTEGRKIISELKQIVMNHTAALLGISVPTGSPTLRQSNKKIKLLS